MEKSLEEAIGDATGKSSNYILNCEVKKVDVAINTPLAEKKGQGSHYQGEAVLLMPDIENTGFARYMSAYYKDFSDDVLPNGEEFIAMIAYPVAQYTRLSFDFGADYQEGFSFLVMSEKADEILKHKVGEKLTIEIMPENFEGEHEMDC